MFVRNVSINMKPNSVAEFSKILESQIVPLMRKQPGFRDEVAFVNDNANHITEISIWESKEQADAYQASAYAEALKSVASLIDGTPKVRTSSVINSTLEAPAALTTA